MSWNVSQYTYEAKGNLKKWCILLHLETHSGGSRLVKMGVGAQAYNLAILRYFWAKRGGGHMPLVPTPLPWSVTDTCIQNIRTVFQPTSISSCKAYHRVAMMQTCYDIHNVAFC